ncbi:hypothetical protein M3J09_011464 [Ascochyta lentis]
MEKAAAYAGTLQEQNVWQHGHAEQQPPYRDPDLDPRGMRSSVPRTVTHPPLHVIRVLKKTARFRKHVRRALCWSLPWTVARRGFTTESAPGNC